jgi:hypothetical protein
LATRVASLLGSNKGIKVLTPIDPTKEIECYVPNVDRVRSEIYLPQPLPLDEAILRTAKWARNN